ncbi:transporter substrate-binding domain-containing protein [Mumia sp. zg.B53]|uniref:transporter substrate-binding domain-containing protein n=1 Tax=unclassified Mumia TaxID=2621872 RepID=UPI001C6E8E40|nr:MULTISPECIES: transporter substrate-binding domain-containing protein [unclassified Mumia]MBW9204916.1 transporter substrate-binding domain-containing protein [Mumia sp. zg.B17]MBW9213691.1 transporter substrate-binding domain-containing protein [Mumia sp. zg.B53]
MKVTGRRLGRAAAAAAGALALTVTMVACGGDGDDSAAEVDGIKLVSADTLTICTNMPYKPFQYEEGDEIIGFDTDLLTLVADDMGLKTKIVDVDWNQVTSGAAFKAGKCDVGMGGMTITDERAKAIAISDPYFEATQALLVKADSGITGLDDLKGKKLGVQVDTTGQIYAEDNADKFGYSMPAFDDLSLEVTGLQAGRVDAVINDNGVLYDFVKDNPEFAVATEFDTGEEYGFAAAKDANGEKMIDKVNEVLKAAEEDGKYEEIYKKYFGEAPASE